jgi:hypothetical protein
MAQSADVHQTMLSVELALARAQRSGKLPPTLYVDGMDPGVFGADNLRRSATIVTEFHSGSDRPMVGFAIRHTKRVVRRALRWYVAGVFDQQSRFNHRLVDLIAQMTVQQEHLLADIAMLDQTVQDQQRDIEELQNAIGHKTPVLSGASGKRV